jgi:hypothetical protein
VLTFDALPTGAAIARQFITRPLVYLDHWAWMDLADDYSLGGRFAELLASRGGSAAFSDVGWVEFADVADLGRLRRVEDLWRRLDHRLFFLNTILPPSMTGYERWRAMPSTSRRYLPGGGSSINSPSTQGPL